MMPFDRTIPPFEVQVVVVHGMGQSKPVDL